MKKKSLLRFLIFAVASIALNLPVHAALAAKKAVAPPARGAADCDAAATALMAATQSLHPDQKEVVDIEVEGAGDVVERLRLPALIELRKEGYKFNVVFFDAPPMNETAEQRAVREHRIKLIQDAGFEYVNKNTPDGRARFNHANSKYADFALPGQAHMTVLREIAHRIHQPGRIFLEKPIMGSLEEAEGLREITPFFDDSIMGMDHYRPKLRRNSAVVAQDFEFLGELTEFEFTSLEDRSGSDPTAAQVSFAARDGAIEREGRQQAFAQMGTGEDMGAHSNGALSYWGDLSSIRPVKVKAGRYKGVDGDPNKPTEVPRETFFSAEFRFKTKQGNSAKGKMILGKGVRTEAYGAEYEHEAKFLILRGKNGEIRFDLRRKGKGASTVTYWKKVRGELQLVKTEPIESDPYKEYYRSMITGNSRMDGLNLTVDEATDVRKALQGMTRFVGATESIPLYDGGMAAREGQAARPAPRAEDLVKKLPDLQKKYLAARRAKLFESPLRTDVSADRDFLIIGGLGAMGQGFTRRTALVAGKKVVFTERAQTPEERATQDAIVAKFEPEAQENILRGQDLRDAISRLQRPRKLMFIIPVQAAGPLIQDLLGLLQPGDVVIDACNGDWRETEERQKLFAAKGISFIGMGVSGGTRGARDGSAMMAGGDPKGWKLVEPILQAIAARIPDLFDPSVEHPSVELVGPGGAGHFVKAVHNGIEYGELQLITEVYGMMKSLLGMKTEEIKATFDQWDQTKLHSFLLTTTSKVLGLKDPKTSLPMLDVIAPIVKENGTGQWTSEAALAFKAVAPTISTPVFERWVTQMGDLGKDVKAAWGESPLQQPGAEDREMLAKSLSTVMYVARILLFAQGIDIMQNASAKHFNNELSLQRATQVWRRGSILQGDLLENIATVYQKNAALKHLLLDPAFQKEVASAEKTLENVIVASTRAGYRAPVLSSLLDYLRIFSRNGQTNANLIMAIRSYFGAHPVIRVDDPTLQRLDWGEAGQQ